MVGVDRGVHARQGAAAKTCVKRYLDAAARRAAKQLPAVRKELAGLKGCPRQQVSATVKIMGVYPRAASLARAGRLTAAGKLFFGVSDEVAAIAIQQLDCLDEMVDAWDVRRPLAEPPRGRQLDAASVAQIVT